MLKLLKKLFFRIYRKSIQETVDEGIWRVKKELIAEALQKSISRTAEYNAAVVESLVGKPVICFGNHNGNPLVGFCVRSTQITQAHVPVPVVANYVNLETNLVLGKVFIFTYQRYLALLNMTGEQRWSLFGMDSQYNYYDLNVKFDEPEEPILSKEEVDALLEQNGFWRLLSEYEEATFKARQAEEVPA